MNHTDYMEYVLQDGITYGTSLKLLGVQIISVNGQAGVDSGDLGSEEVAAMFGTTKGYKIEEPNVVPKPDEDASEDDDFWEYNDFDEMYDHFIHSFAWPLITT